MTRKEFLSISAALGIGAPFLSTIGSCNDGLGMHEEFDVNFSGQVLVIGAGAAGLTAGYLLNKYGIDFQILEASDVYGGRVREVTNFADFPIDLGAEWIHTDPTILSRLLSDSSVNAEVDIINYSPETLYIWKNGKLKKRNFFTNFYSEHKFKNTTWFSFFDNYMVPGIRDRITLNSPVKAIDYSSEKIIVSTEQKEYEADKVILTVPLTILKQDLITFIPEFPVQKRNALREVEMPDGMKVFIEFSERFYPDMTYDGGLSEIMNNEDGEKIFYDAAFRKDTDKHILGLFTVGKQATTYTSQPSEGALKEHLLQELDTIFDGQASKYYQKHIVQNWSAEPYIRGSYSHYHNMDAQGVLAAPIEDKIYFAGEAYAEDYSTAHGAAESAYTAVEEILAN